MNHYLVLFTVFEATLLNCVIGDIGSSILNYYKGETVESFNRQWEQHRKSYENALVNALRESFGRKAMNTIERKKENTCKLSNGFYAFDNIVHLVFQDMHLYELPHLKDLEINFLLAHNVLNVEAELSKMIIETKYSVMRNSSEVLFSGTTPDPYQNSPFVLQQVQNEGILAIIVEGCSLEGLTIVKLSGLAVDLGHNTFAVRNCQFSIEISGAGLPPVIAPYFSMEQESLLENLISNPIRRELMTKLKSAVFSYVNTSIFDSNLPAYRAEQENIFKLTRDYIKKIIRDSNKETIMKDRASQDLDPLQIIWTENQGGTSNNELIALNDIIVDGFDTAYTPHNGGPYKLETAAIAETLRYNTLKVHGKIIFEHDNVKNEHNFYMELQDVTVNVAINLNDSSQISFNTDGCVYWRDSDFSVTNIEQIKERITAESMITGYLISKLPKYVSNNILKLLYIDESANSNEIKDKTSTPHDDIDESANSNEIKGKTSTPNDHVDGSTNSNEIKEKTSTPHDDDNESANSNEINENTTTPNDGIDDSGNSNEIKEKTSTPHDDVDDSANSNEIKEKISTPDDGIDESKNSNDIKEETSIPPDSIDEPVNSNAIEENSPDDNINDDSIKTPENLNINVSVEKPKKLHIAIHEPDGRVDYDIILNTPNTKQITNSENLKLQSDIMSSEENARKKMKARSSHGKRHHKNYAHKIKQKKVRKTLPNIEKK